MLFAIVPVIVLILGLLMWALGPAKPTVSDIGKVMFCVGLLVFTLVAAHSTVRLFG